MKDHVSAKERLSNFNASKPHFRQIMKRIKSWLSLIK